MRSTFKLLILLVAVELGVSALVHRRIGGLESKKSCGKGQYYSTEAGFCDYCTICEDFFYEADECTDTKDTVCKWCGTEVNFAEASEKLLDAYEEKCMIGRVEYISKIEDMGRPAKKTEKMLIGEDDNGFESENTDEDSKETDREQFVKKMEAQIENEESERKHREICQEGQYYNSKVEACFNCTSCGYFLYETAKCTKTSNTVCTWCGVEPPFAGITDVVLASYQNQCLMVQLPFVDMHGLIYEDSDEYDSEEDSSDYENESNIDAQMQIALEKKEEEDLVRKINTNSRTYVIENDSEEQSVEEEENNEEKENEDDLEIKVSHTVNAYFIQKGKPVEKETEESKEDILEETVEEEDENEIKEETLEEEEEERLKPIGSEEKFYNNLKYPYTLNWSKTGFRMPIKWIMNGPRENVKKVTMDEPEEPESVSPVKKTLIWDEWVDDKIRPIKRVEIVEAEEIEPFEDIEIQQMKDDEILIEGTESSQYKLSLCFRVLLVLSLCMFVVSFSYLCYAHTCAKMFSEKRVFTGVPLDSPDYHMILHASRHIEELEAREKKASKHIHENPIFDI